MRYLHIGLIVLTISACGPNPPGDKIGGGATQPPSISHVLDTTVRPMEITRRSTGQDPVGHVWSVVGKIYYGRPNPGEPGILSDGVGGACLVMQQSRSCETTLECAPLTGGSSYCLDKRPVGRRNVGQCWVRGADYAWCLKSGTDLPESGGKLEVGKTYAVPKHEFATIQGPANVRLVTCLNPPAKEWPVVNGRPTPPCAGGTPGALHIAGMPVAVP
jgi:hypothetical protein